MTPSTSDADATGTAPGSHIERSHYPQASTLEDLQRNQIGRASCRERV